MATIESIRPATTGSAAGAASLPDQAAFLTGAPEDRLAGLVAFALAAERQEDASPETVSRLRQEAEAALCDNAFRTLHNRVEQLRREAVAEQFGRLPRPPGLARLIVANLVALAVAGAAGGWLALHPATLAGLTGLLTG